MSTASDLHTFCKSAMHKTPYIMFYHTFTGGLLEKFLMLFQSIQKAVTAEYTNLLLTRSFVLLLNNYPLSEVKKMKVSSLTF